ncbi:MAG: hypothetical protein R6X02_08170 [Enhygromyxa sp.]
MQRSKFLTLTVSLVALSVLLGVLLLGTSWWLARPSSEALGAGRSATNGSRDAGELERPGLRTEEQATAGAGRADQSKGPSARARRAEFDRARRDALRAEILEALAEQPSRPSGIARAKQEPSDEQLRPPGTLKDRIGGREALAEFLNHDFIPLADECVEQAQARLPGLEGMLAIGLDTVADAELGGVVEVVEIRPNNEVEDPELLECISQTALSMILPPPPESGREQFVITMPIEPAPE